MAKSSYQKRILVSLPKPVPGLRSLNAKLVAPFVALSVLAAIASAFAAWQFFQSREAQAQAARTNQVASRIANRIAGLESMADGLPSYFQSAVTTYLKGARAPADLQALLAGALQATPLARSAQFDPDDNVGRVSLLKVDREIHVGGLSSVAASSGWSIARQNASGATEALSYRVRLVGDSTSTNGWLTLEIPLTALRQSLASSADTSSLARIDLVSAQGLPLAEIMPGSTSRDNPLFPQVSTTVAALGVTQWHIGATAPQIDDGHSSTAIWKALAIGLLPLAFGLWYAWRVMHRSVSDIDRLARASERFKFGAALDTLPIQRSDEIGRLARAVAAMSNQATGLIDSERSRTALGAVVVQAQHDAIESQRSVLARSQEQVRRFSAVVEAAYEGIAILDRKFRIDYVNPAFANEFRMPMSILKGLRISDLFHADAKDSIDKFESALDLGLVVRETIRCKRADEGDLYAELTASPIREDDGEISGLVIVERDVTARVMTTESISRELLIDPLTDVWRRSALISNLERRVARPEHTKFSVLFIDLDGFKLINDRFGHEAGDTVLRAVGAILKGQIRENDVAARYGGDEFVIVVDDDGKESNARRVAQRVIAAIPTVTGLRFPDLHFAASIGIACFPRDADTAADVVRCADHAMYTAKRRGGNGVTSWIDVKVKPNWNSAPPSAEVLTLRRRS